MNLRIYRCRECGKRLHPWTPMCDNCRRLAPAVLLWGVLVVVGGILGAMLLLEWAFDFPLLG
ncbi:MAG: hypothetical protein R6V58_08800 [Planctomycetota bacterium]